MPFRDGSGGGVTGDQGRNGMGQAFRDGPSQKICEWGLPSLVMTLRSSSRLRTRVGSGCLQWQFSFMGSVRRFQRLRSFYVSHTSRRFPVLTCSVCMKTKRVFESRVGSREQFPDYVASQLCPMDAASRKPPAKVRRMMTVLLCETYTDEASVLETLKYMKVLHTHLAGCRSDYRCSLNVD